MHVEGYTVTYVDMHGCIEEMPPLKWHVACLEEIIAQVNCEYRDDKLE